MVPQAKVLMLMSDVLPETEACAVLKLEGAGQATKIIVLYQAGWGALLCLFTRH